LLSDTFPSLDDTDEKFDHDYILILKPPKNRRIDQLIVRKITKIVVTRCLDFSSKCSKMRLALCQDPLGELERSPDPLASKRGPTSKERGGEGREGKGREGVPPNKYLPLHNCSPPVRPSVRHAILGVQHRIKLTPETGAALTCRIPEAKQNREGLLLLNLDLTESRGKLFNV